MGEQNRGQVSVQLEDGTIISDFLSFSLTDSYTDPLGSYEFTIRPRRADILTLRDKLQKGEVITVTINGNSQGRYLIETVKTRIEKNTGVEYGLTCNTLLSTPHEGSVDPDISESFQADTPVSEVVLLALNPYGFTTIVSDTSANLGALSGKPLDGRKAEVRVEEIKHKEAKAHEGETAYGFPSRIFSRLGLALRINAQGFLLLGSPDYDQQAAYQLEQSSAPTRRGDAMIGEITINDTNAGQFSEVVVRGTTKDTKGQKHAGRPIHRLRVEGLGEPPVTPPFDDAPGSTIPQGRHSYKSDVAPFKPLYKLDKFSRDQDYCQNRANRIIGRRAESGFVLECTVDGLISATGRIWQVDTIARVRIEMSDIDEDMWILQTTRTMDRGQAQQTKLKLIPLGSLLLGVQ